MSIQYSWEISSLEIAPSENGLSNVIKQVNWTYKATDGTNTVSTSGALNLDNPDQSNFIPYQSVTFDTVKSWLNNQVDKQYLEIYLNSLLEKIANNLILVNHNPWS